MLLHGQSQRVLYRGAESAEWQLLLGVHQGLVLGPILFLLYTAELFDFIAECGLTTHTYADDMQVYISTPATDHVDAMDRLAACIERIRDWMADYHLKLNEEKTQIIWQGTRQQLNKLTARAVTLPNATVKLSATVKDLCVVLDSQLTMADHIAALGRSCFLYMYIRQLRSIRQSQQMQ